MKINITYLLLIKKEIEKNNEKKIMRAVEGDNRRREDTLAPYLDYGLE